MRASLAKGGATMELRTRLLMTERVAADHTGHAATMFTSFGGRTTTRLTA